MNPFEQPPTTPPVSLDPPSASGHDGPRRGRMALAALAAAGLVGGGLVVVGQFASADRPTLGTAASVDDPVETTVSDDAAPAEPADEASTDEVGLPSIDGEIVIDDGDGEPTVIDLGDLGDLDVADLEARMGRLSECLGLPALGDGPARDGMPPLLDEGFEQRMEEFLDELPWDELGDLDLGELDDGVRIFGSGGSTVTVVGPDGVELIDLGDGDATVTIEQRDGEVSVETDGDATVVELPELPFLPGLDPGEIGGELDLGELGREWRERHAGGLDLGGLLPFDADELEACLDDVTGDTADG